MAITTGYIVNDQVSQTQLKLNVDCFSDAIICDLHVIAS